MTLPGRFITFEGPEGAGKSTQIALLAERLRSAGEAVTMTREPGGTPGGEALRDVLLNPAATWSPLAEALLMNAARDAHMQTLILPALQRGETVLCDRFAASTLAYQGDGVAPETLAALEAAVVVRRPDLVLLLDLPVAEGLARAKARSTADRFEGRRLDYHEGVRARFLELAAKDPNMHCIDAAQPQDDVSAAILEVMRAHYPDWAALP
ncbi:thymidylate kinase [Parvularcula bermudensis HTCC2503]|uniref:Thymidylate kinase n=1 Tax=Parvularcula bermudensis (strain ATCC BAA-594 / HTCC2503 / KCTC 12087) TaxID=314260 RepID=E0TIF2_PARBH|nr:dTMP kinase [Parvularcula bermudensis]ADM10271.1 thymidylate kinase [Parvularcula bermudensis HTCC2503]